MSVNWIRRFHTVSFHSGCHMILDEFLWLCVNQVNKDENDDENDDEDSIKNSLRQLLTSSTDN